MSIDMYLSDSQAQATSAWTMADSEMQAYADIEIFLSTFESSTDQLKGQAYDSARAYVGQVLKPLVRGGRLLSEAIGTAIKRFPEAYVEQVAAESLKESELLRDIQSLDSEIALANQNISDLGKGELSATDESRLTNYQNIVSSATESRSLLQEKLDKLRNFNNSSPQIFSEIASLKSLVDQGLAQLGNGWNAERGIYVLPTDLTWATNLNHMSPMNPTDGEKLQIIGDYMQTYGLDWESANVLYTLQQGILNRAEEENWSNKKVLFEYNRLLASFVPENYVSLRWKAICGTEEKEERDRLCREYGLSNEDIAILEVSIKKQHEDANQSKDLAHEAVQIAAFTEESWDLISIDNGVHRLSHVVNEGLEHEEISFKGDVDSGRYSDSDFNSDLDAINYYNRATSENVNRYDIFQINAEYNSSIQDNSVNRVDEFYDNYDQPGIIFGIGRQSGEEVVEDIIETETIGSRHISSQYTEEQQEGHKEDFYDYLERGEYENVD